MRCRKTLYSKSLYAEFFTALKVRCSIAYLFISAKEILNIKFCLKENKFDRKKILFFVFSRMYLVFYECIYLI